MRAVYNDFLVNGKPILVPDADVSLQWSDLDAYSAGRDESGVMHRVVVRHRVPKWGFEYATLTKEELQYLRALFAGLATFTFTYRDEFDTVKTCKAYCSNDSVSYRDASKGLYKNYRLSIIAC